MKLKRYLDGLSVVARGFNLMDSPVISLSHQAETNQSPGKSPPPSSIAFAYVRGFKPIEPHESH